MSNPPNNGRNRPLRGGPDKFQPKVLLIWAAIILGMISLFMLTEPAKKQIQELSISQVVDAAKNDYVASGTIRPNVGSGHSDWSEIQGEFKAGSPPADGLEPTFTARGRLTDEDLEILRGSGTFKEEPSSQFQGMLLNMMFFILLIALAYFLFIRQLRMAGRGAMNFGKSRAKMLTRDRERVTFKDVAGCDEAKEEVAEIVEFLKDPKKFQRIGGRIPKGCLLVGPPGTGKTLIARAVAGEAEVPFFSISGSDFVEMFVGVGAARVRDMFEQGRKSAPCIIFIDEIDAVGRQRGAGLGGGNDEREQTLNSLLVEMDGFDAHEGVIIMAATNRPDVLDSALLRPGRFDRQIVIDLPDLVGREEILRVHAKKIQMVEGLDLSIVARSTPGFSGADLANLLNEAALLAARYGKNKVDLSDIDEARDKISYGRERRRLMDDEDKRIIAYHEAGHAIVQAIIDDGRLPLHKVTIIPRGQALGMAMMMPKKDILNQSRSFLLNRVCTAMGGRIAEDLVFGDVTSGASSDIKGATKIARHMVCDFGMSTLGPVAYGENQDHIFLGREIARDQNYSEQTAREIDAAIRRIVDEQYERAKGIIIQHRTALDKLAELLLKHETLEGKHVHEIIESGDIRSPVAVHPRQSPETLEEADQKQKDKERKKRKSEEGLSPGTEPAIA